MGKRGPKKGRGGRPRGSGIGKYAGDKAKTPEEIRAVWRQYYYFRNELRRSIEEKKGDKHKRKGKGKTKG